jgi:hypothetical protein
MCIDRSTPARHAHERTFGFFFTIAVVVEPSGSHFVVAVLKGRPVGQQLCPDKPATGPLDRDRDGVPSAHTHLPSLTTNDAGSEGSHRGVVGGSHLFVSGLKR